jgi:hypothetical protein
MAPWPRGAICTSAPRGQGAMPLAVRSSEGLGVTGQRAEVQLAVGGGTEVGGAAFIFFHAWKPPATDSAFG